MQTINHKAAQTSDTIKQFNWLIRSLLTTLLVLTVFAFTGCGGSDSDSILSVDDDSATETNDDSTDDNTADDTSDDEVVVDDSSDDTSEVDITDVIFTETSADCADYATTTTASVEDITENQAFTGSVVITAGTNSCSLSSNSIPNHDFNDSSAAFASKVSEVAQNFTIPRNPSAAASTTELTQMTYNGVMLNGVVLDIISAGCYSPLEASADADGNVSIGCSSDDAWLMDPLGTDHKFGADAHNAHPQPDGSYHYHGSPNAMFDTNPGANGSPVIGFAADGFPIYGSYYYDPDLGVIVEAESGYTLKSGSRPGPDNSDPGGTYDGSYNDDYEFTDAGNLDACNGRTVDGQYGYYVTDAYPWVMRCFTGTSDSSFDKGGPS